MVQVLIAIEDRIPGVSTNVPPEWVGTPSPPIYESGKEYTYSLLPFVFDEDGDELYFSDAGAGFLTLSFDTEAFDEEAFDYTITGLPEGVTIVGSDIVIASDAPASTSTVQLYVSDNINAPQISNSFSLIITEDIPPVFISIPNPQFTAGNAATYDFNNDISDDGVSSIVWSISGSLPNDISFNTVTGILTYNGGGVETESAHTVTALDGSGTPVTSSVFNIIITGFQQANHIIPLNVSEWSAASVQPGEIIEIEAGSRQILKITYINGDPSNPIIIRNEPGKLCTISDSRAKSGGFTFWLQGGGYCLDGYSYPPAGSDYGIFVSRGNTSNVPSALMCIWNGTSGTNKVYASDIEIKGIHIDGINATANDNVPIGMSHNDSRSAYSGTSNPGVWIENVNIHHCWVHDLPGEGLYIGPNWFEDRIRLRDIEVHHCLIERTVKDGVQVKSTLQGTNSIHHITCLAAGGVGAPTYGSQNTGISFYEGYGDVYNCYIEDGGEFGIWNYFDNIPESYGGPYPTNIYNNVVVRCGWSTAPNTPNETAIAVNNSNLPSPSYYGTIYNNTIISAKDEGIYSVSSKHDMVARNNIVCDCPTPIIGMDTDTNNIKTTIAALNFVDPDNDDYHLTSSSTLAIDLATGLTPAYDLDDNVRDASPDIGAYEFIEDIVPPITRNLRVENTYSSDFLTRGATADADGIYRDIGTDTFNWGEWGSPITISNITKANPAVATYTGTLVRDDDNFPPGYTLGEITSGMTELSGRLFRPKNIRTESGLKKFDMYMDSPTDSGVNTGLGANGDYAINSTGYGTFSGSVQAQAYKYISNTLLASSFGGKIAPKDQNISGYPYYPHIRITNGAYTPPTNSVGSANTVLPQTGSQFLSTNIEYWIDHSRSATGATEANQGQNKPRWQFPMANSALKLNSSDTIWVGFSIMLPSNFDNSSTTTSGNTSAMQIAELQDDPNTAANNLWLLEIRRDSGDATGIMSWQLQHYSAGSLLQDQKISTVTADIGLWTTFIFKFIYGTDGELKVWKSTGSYTTGFQRNMSLAFNYEGDTTLPTTPYSPYGFDVGLKQYKHGWHHFTGNIPGPNFWLGWDNFRFGTTETDGTEYRDVHPYYNSANVLYTCTNAGTSDGTGYSLGSPGTIHYITSSDTIADVNALSLNVGDAVLFEAGNSWDIGSSMDGKLQCVGGVTYGRYGTGDNPVITHVSGNLGSGNNFQGVIEINNVDDVVVDGIDVKYGTEAHFGIYAVNADNVTISRLTVSEILGGGVIMGVGTTNATCELLHIYNVDGGPHESLAFTGTDTYIARYNYIHNCNHAGINNKGNAKNGEIYGNEIHSIQNDPSLYVERGENIEIHDNYVHHPSETGTFKVLMGCNIENFGADSIQYNRNIDIYNNTFMGTVGKALRFWIKPDVAVSAVTQRQHDIHVHHNNFIDINTGNTTWQYGIHATDGRPTPQPSEWSSNVIEDNIIWRTGNADAIHIDNGVHTGFTIRNNLFLTGSTGSPSLGTDPIYTTEAPFVDWRSRDFTLRGAAIGAGYWSATDVGAAMTWTCGV